MPANKPTILLPDQYSEKDVEKLRKVSKPWREVNLYDQQLDELLEIRYPNLYDRQNHKEAFLKQYNSTSGAWVYLPWNGILLHTVGPEELFELRTNRNQNIITKKEQQKLYDAVIGVAGMSVGAGVAVGTIYSGIANTIKLADFDKLETTNLNRVRQSLSNVGQPKLDLAAQSVYEIDPFINVQTFAEGITRNNIDSFFKDPKLNIVVDEIDDFKMKVMLRVKAKENEVPLLMFTSLGDNILIDVERYDLSPQPKLFNGAVDKTVEEIAASDNITPEDIKRFAVQSVGQEYVPTRALASLPEIGKTLVGRPQLYSTIAVDGGLAAYLIRQILLGTKIKSGRYFVKFSEMVGLEDVDFVQDNGRKDIIKNILGSKNEYEKQ